MTENAQPVADDAAEQSLADIAADKPIEAKAEAPSVEIEEEGEQPEAPAIEEDPDAADAAEPEPDVEEYEFDGKKYKLPKDVIPAIMKNADYTRKTQELAERRREFEAQQEAFEAERKRTTEDLQIDGYIAQLQSELQAFDRLDWNAIAQNDLYEAQQKQFQRGLIRDKLAELTGIKETRSQARASEAQKAMTARINEAEAWGAANIPNWSEGRDKELLTFAREVIGYDDQALRQMVSKPFLEMLHKAWIGHKASTKAATTPQATPKAEVKPVPAVSAKSGKTNRVSLANADMETYRAARARGVDPTIGSLLR
jgi:hypothetical protein